MTLVLNLEPELESAIQAEAHRNGVKETDLVLTTLRHRFRDVNHESSPTNLSKTESDLLIRINNAVQNTVWEEYDRLNLKRKSETLSDDEQRRLIELSDDIDAVHFDRIAAASEFAELRSIPLKQLMLDLGIRPRNSADAHL